MKADGQPTDRAEAASGTGPILRVHGLHVRYGSHDALRDVTFSMAVGERVAVVGPNAAGKSTLFRVVAGLERPSTGSVTVHGHRPGVGVCVAYVQQRSAVDWTFPVSVTDVVMMGRIGRIGLLRQPGPSDWARVRECLETVRLADLGGVQIGTLSGGQAQRMFIARALAQEAEMVLMDEPLTGLDVRSKRDILAVLDTLHDAGVSVMVATHDLDLAAEHFERALLLNGRIVGDGRPNDAFSAENLLAAYGGRVNLIDPGHGPSWANEGRGDV